MTTRRSREHGFTALEVLVASMLLSVGLLASAQLIVLATTQGHLAKQESDAGTLAAQTIEQYRDMNYANLAGGSFVTSPVVGSDQYTVTADVTRNNPQINMTRVKVTVTWNGGTRSYVSETILSNLQ